jgi:hypothetical protein
MSPFALRLPGSLFERARVLAQRDNTSLNQFITLAVAERVSALETAGFLPDARRGVSWTTCAPSSARFPTFAPQAGDER